MARQQRHEQMQTIQGTKQDHVKMMHFGTQEVMNNRDGNWHKTRMNSFFGHRVCVYLLHSLIFPYSLRIFKILERK